MDLRVIPDLVFLNRMIARGRALFLVSSALVSSLFTVAAETPSSSPPNDGLPLTGFAEIGSSFVQSGRLNQLGWTEDQIQAFTEGVRAALHGKAYPFGDAAHQVSSEMARRLHEMEERAKAVVSEFSQPGKVDQYMKETRKRLRLQQTSSGLAYRIEAGRGGARPRPEDTVIISSVAHAADGVTDLPQLTFENVRVKVSDLIPGLLEGVQMVTLDGKAFLVIPPSLLFGNTEWPSGMDKNAPVQVQLTLHEMMPATP